MTDRPTIRNDERRRRLKAARQRRWRRSVRRRERLRRRLRTKALELPPIVAEIRSYGDLIEALKGRRRSLGLTQEQVDVIAGFTDRYTSKIEVGRRGTDPMQAAVNRLVNEARVAEAKRRAARKGRRRRRTTGRALGDMSLPVLLQALRLRLVVVQEEEVKRPRLNGADLARRVPPTNNRRISQ